MCLAFPGKIVEIRNQQATADFDGIRKEINISLVPDADPGDYIIVHAGFAIQKLTDKDAWEVLREYDRAVKIRKNSLVQIL
jgi:hydrogenase expression/formation protein HypC